MRVSIGPDSVSIWLSTKDTYDWANRPNNRWPCSELANNRVFVSFDVNGINDLAINGKEGDVSTDELSACIADYLAKKLPYDHPCFFVVVGQFQPGVNAK